MGHRDELHQEIGKIISVVRSYENMLLKLFLSFYPNVYPIPFLPSGKQKLRRYIIFLMFVSEKSSYIEKLSLLYKELCRFQGFNFEAYSTLYDFTTRNYSEQELQKVFDIYKKSMNSFNTNEHELVREEKERASEELSNIDFMEKVYLRVYNHISLGKVELV